MKSFTSTNEKEFLLGYLSFTVEVRSIGINVLKNSFDKTSEKKEKLLYYILGLEQLFLLYESMQAFFIAFRDRNRRPFLDSLNKNVGIQSLYEWFKDKSKDQNLKALNYKTDNMVFDMQKINQRLTNLSKMWSSQKFANVMKTIINPMFHTIKHKLLLYEKAGDIIFVLGDKQEEETNNLLNKLNLTGLNSSSFEVIIEIEKRWVNIIKDLIILRLIELGVDQSEIKRNIS